MGFALGAAPTTRVLKAREYVACGKRWVVDMDLEKFFDRVNHDVLMARVARKVKDKRCLDVTVEPETASTDQGIGLSVDAVVPGRAAAGRRGA